MSRVIPSAYIEPMQTISLDNLASLIGDKEHMLLNTMHLVHLSGENLYTLLEPFYTVDDQTDGSIVDLIVVLDKLQKECDEEDVTDVIGDHFDTWQQVIAHIFDLYYKETLQTIKCIVYG